MCRTPRVRASTTRRRRGHRAPMMRGLVWRIRRMHRPRSCHCRRTPPSRCPCIFGRRLMRCPGRRAPRLGRCAAEGRGPGWHQRRTRGHRRRRPAPGTGRLRRPTRCGRTATCTRCKRWRSSRWRRFVVGRQSTARCCSACRSCRGTMCRCRPTRGASTLWAFWSRRSSGRAASACRRWRARRPEGSAPAPQVSR